MLLLKCTSITHVTNAAHLDLALISTGKSSLRAIITTICGYFRLTHISLSLWLSYNSRNHVHSALVNRTSVSKVASKFATHE